jgi:hypothetical protein
MSCDADFSIEVCAEKKVHLQKMLKYLEEKKMRWDSWKASGKSSTELLEATGEKNFADVVSWGFQWGRIKKAPGQGYKVEGTAWANENSSNVHISGANGELASIAARFPEVEWSVEYSDEYGQEAFLTAPDFEPYFD